MSKAIEMSGLAVRCGNDDCNFYKDITADEFYDYVNKPCPKCGKPALLTDDDAAMFEAIKSTVEFINSITGDIAEDAEYQTVAIGSDGKGNVFVNGEPVEDFDPEVDLNKTLH